MSDESLVRHKTYTIRLVSYQLDDEWAPKALVYKSSENEERGHPIAGKSSHRLPTKDAADAMAKKLAIEWIDAQFPSAAD